MAGSFSNKGHAVFYVRPYGEGRRLKKKKNVFREQNFGQVARFIRWGQRKFNWLLKRLRTVIRACHTESRRVYKYINIYIYIHRCIYVYMYIYMYYIILLYILLLYWIVCIQGSLLSSYYCYAVRARNRTHNVAPLEAGS